MDGVTFYKTRDEAEKMAQVYRKRRRVKTDVFRVKEENGLFYVEQSDE